MPVRLIFGGCAAVGAVLVALNTGAFDSPLPADESRRADPVASAEDASRSTVRRQFPNRAVPSAESSIKSADPGASYRLQLSAMLAAAEHETNPDRQESMVRDLVAWIQAADPAASLTLLSHQDSSEIMLEVRDRVLEQMAILDPEKAANIALHLSGQNRWESVAAVLCIWAGDNVQAAIDWVNRLPRNEEKKNAVLSIAWEAARTEPEMALELASGLPASGERDDMIAHAAAQWAAIDPASASAWAVDIDEGPFREHLLTMIATAWGDQNPAAAAALALKTLPPGKPQSDAVVGIVQRWTQQNPESASAWVSAFPEGDLRNAVMENFIKLWA
ncbi:MAG: hypothetical protein ABI680_10780, partial [Chthoniobacteraceae bacterium]